MSLPDKYERLFQQGEHTWPLSVVSDMTNNYLDVFNIYV